MTSPMILGIIALGTGLAVIPMIRWWAMRSAMVDTPGSEAHKQHDKTVPYGGGIGVALAVSCAICIAWLTGAPSLPGWPMLGGALALLIIGAVDDIRPLPARLKLALQILVVVAAVSTGGVIIDSLRNMPILAVGVAVVWCLITTNAFNLLDHADGLSASTAVISVIVLLIIALAAQDSGLVLIWTTLLGSLLAFLAWNLPPARIYMGDAGALSLGFLIGYGTLSATVWPSAAGTGSPLSVLSPALIVALPLYDTIVVVIKRLRRGRPVMTGDRNHISHRLQRLGLSSGGSLLVAVTLQTSMAVTAIMLLVADGTIAVLALAHAVCLILVSTLLEAKRDRGD